MKFNFKIQEYQTDAVDSVVRVFRGQPKQSRLSYVRDLGKMKELQAELTRRKEKAAVGQGALVEDGDELSDTGYKNEVVKLTESDLLSNIRQVQGMNRIQTSPELVQDMGCCSLDIEMETGTGKTYVYIKTMFELNKQYGWSKFIVVVPSIAIREGVKKTFEITTEHFMQHYGKKARFFVYDSKNLNQLDGFASDAGINVMIINMQAFSSSMKEDGRSKEARIIYSKRDNFGSRRPIDVIAANHPIIIRDEPQKMGGPATKKGLKKFQPLFLLNYSATHKEKHNLIYVLDAVDAFNKRLVKKIEVKGFDIKNLVGTNSYIYLEDILLSPKKPPQVRIELEVARKSGTKREIHLFEERDNLCVASGNMEQYRHGYSIAGIDPVAGTVSFTNGLVLHKGEVSGDVSEQDMRRIQIRETIRSHFEKEKDLFARGIKTLSLFFIDEVAKYRQYDEDGNELLGDYGKIFEQEYRLILQEQQDLFAPDYMKYLDGIAVADTHRGYFSIDKKGHAIDSPLKRNEESSEDISAYDLILKNKERLLSFEEPTRFIFSHSALREGWDNPNVFQICTLKQSDNQTAKRQEVGRGMRLCVDQQGNRMDAESCGDLVQELNLLTVIASESYTKFVTDLQKDMTDDLNSLYRQRQATMEFFTGKVLQVAEQPVRLDEKQAKVIYQYLCRNEFVNEDDHITETYKSAVNKNDLPPLPESLLHGLPESLQQNPQQTMQSLGVEIHKLVQSVFDDDLFKAYVKDGSKPKIRENPLNDNFKKKEFQNLWQEINHHYAYTVSFNSEELITKAIVHIDDKLYVSELQYTMQYATQQDNIDAGMVADGDSFAKTQSHTERLEYRDMGEVTYDLLGKIVEGTKLTRRTVAAILQKIKPEKFAMFRQNPEEFIRKVSKLINEEKATMIVEKITYHKLEQSYDSAIFTAEQHSAEFDKAFLSYNHKHIQDYVFTDGTAYESVERRFAERLEGADEVKIYAKLPRGFQIPTPVGNYAPDWAIVFHEGMVKHIYFVAETKGSMESMDLRPIERAKIDCTKKLFDVLSNGKIRYDQVDNYDELLNIMNK